MGKFDLLIFGLVISHKDGNVVTGEMKRIFGRSLTTQTYLWLRNIITIKAERI
jgi:hypothetical protein